jgi:hypothetical protein
MLGHRSLKKHKQAVLKEYVARMKEFLFAVDVHTLSEEQYKRVTSSIDETGSDLPRALLAYFFAVLSTMRKYSSSPQCPIVIDSPNQQAQDRESLRKMLSFIFTHQPEGSQMILGLEDDTGLKYDADVIRLTDKYSLLQSNAFANVTDELQPLLKAALAE